MSTAFYYQLRQQHPDTLDDLAKASRFVYLNRLCFNGIYRTNRKGEFNVPRGKKTGNIPSEADFTRFSAALGNATLLACDFEACLTSVRNNDFVYLDPPYAKYANIDHGEYGYDGFGERDLERLIKTLYRLHNKGATILLSYAYSELFSDLLDDGWYMRVFPVRRSVAGFSSRRGLVQEVLLSNKEIPPLSND